MANNVTLPGTGVVVETLDQGGGVERQVVSAVQNGTWTVSGTFYQATQPVSIATAPVLVAGSAIIGKVGIDQTTPGTTNLVSTTAKNLLWQAGSGNNGLVATAVQLFHGTGASDEFYGLTTGSYKVSGTSGSSGVFTNSNTSQVIYGELFLTLGAIGSAISAGGNIAGWFLQSYDGGTTYEQGSGVAPSRPPDFVIPLPATTITSGWVYKAAGVVRLPPLNFKVAIQNNTGQTLSSDSVNYLRLAPIAMLD